MKDKAIESKTVIHEIPPVWSKESKVIFLGTMPSPVSRRQGFFYMHPQNRFWKVLPEVFGEKLSFPNNSTFLQEAVGERKDFIIRHRLALWDVLESCEIEGASDASIKKEKVNDFTEIFTKSKIRNVCFTGKAAQALWKKHCDKKYEVNCICLPSTSPANASFSLEKLVSAYKVILPLLM